MSDSDVERQADEIDSLKWIYPQELVVTSVAEPISGYFKISPHLIEDEMIIQVETIINSQTENSNVSIRHLSPIELYFTLPANYPSESQPLFMVNCVWLSHERLTSICRKLDDLWDKNFGCEILFLWVSFLKDDLLQFLSINGLAIKLDMDLKKLSSNENTTDASTLYDVDQKDIKLRALKNKTAAVKHEKENVCASTTSSNIAKRGNPKTKRHSEVDNFKYETPKDIKEKMIGESSTVETSSKQVRGKNTSNTARQCPNIQVSFGCSMGLIH